MTLTDPTIWWLAAGSLLVIEMLTGTFYLFMLAVGVVAGAMAAEFGFGIPVQMTVAAIVGGIASLGWRFYQKLKPITPGTRNPDMNLDVGAAVFVEEWRPDGTSLVQYRGSSWLAKPAAGEIPSAGQHSITEVSGTVLTLKKKQ